MAKGHDAVTRCDNCSGACYAPCTRGAVTLSAPERIQPAFTGVEKYGVRSGMNIDAGVACGVVGLAAGVPAAGATLAASAERGVRLTHGWWLGVGGHWRGPGRDRHAAASAAVRADRADVRVVPHILRRRVDPDRRLFAVGALGTRRSRHLRGLPAARADVRRAARPW